MTAGCYDSKVSDMKLSKQQAVALFGGQTKGLAAALGVTSSAISQWPDVLRPEQVDRVLGAAIRLGVVKCLADVRASESKSDAGREAA